MLFTAVSLFTFALKVVASVLLALLAWCAFTPVEQWRMAKVPGLPHMPLFGTLLRFHKSDQSVEIHKLYMQYTTAFKVWLGYSPFIVIKDPSTARQLSLKLNTRADLSFATLRYGRLQSVWDKTFVFTRKESLWRPVRRAFESVVLNPAALQAQVPFVAMATDRLVERVAALACSGQPIDFLSAAGNLMMDMIAYTAFGLDLHVTDSPNAASRSISEDEQLCTEPHWWRKYPPGSNEFGVRLAASIRMMFAGMDPSRTSIYNVLAILLTPMKPLLQVLAQYLPDKKKTAEVQAYTALTEAIQVLMDDWRARNSKQAPTAAAAGGSATVGLSGQQQILGDSGFLARLLSQEAGEALDDDAIIAALQVMLLGGFETAANTIAIALNCLAMNPEQQRRLHQELDDKLVGRRPDMKDFDSLPYLCAVVDETLRLYPATATSFRADWHGSTQVGHGISVPPKAGLIIPLYSFHNDATIWPKADKFLPERFLSADGSGGSNPLAPTNPQAYMPFGLGARMCVGYKLALVEVRMAVARIMQRFAVASVPGVPPVQFRTSLVYRPTHVVLQFSERVRITMAPAGAAGTAPAMAG